MNLIQQTCTKCWPCKAICSSGSTFYLYPPALLLQGDSCSLAFIGLPSGDPVSKWEEEREENEFGYLFPQPLPVGCGLSLKGIAPFKVTFFIWLSPSESLSFVFLGMGVIIASAGFPTPGRTFANSPCIKLSQFFLIAGCLLFPAWNLLDGRPGG